MLPSTKMTPQNGQEKKKILIAEDEFLIALDLQASLRKLGYAVGKLVATGEGVIASLEKERPHVIIMDVNLAGTMNGIQAAQEINSRYAIPIIFMTGYSDKEMLEQVQELHPVACLSKPIQIDEIKSIVDSLGL